MDEVFLRLKALLELFGLTRFYTDHWGAYTRHLDPDVHSPGKRHTQKIERQHLTLRARIKRLVRKTICFSKTRWCPSVPLMDWFKLRKQVFQTVKLIDKQRRHPIRQQLVGRPDMVVQSGCHRWSARPPTPRGSASTRWLVHRQLLSQTVMGQHEMRVCQ